MDSNEKSEMSLDLIDKIAILVYAAKVSSKKRKNTNTSNGLSAFCFKDELEKSQNKFTQSRRPVRNVNVSNSKSADSDNENKCSRAIDRQKCGTKVTISTKRIGEEHESSRSSTFQTEKVGKTCQIPERFIEDAMKKMQQSAASHKVNSPIRIIPKVSNYCKKSVWQTEQSESENSDNESPIPSTSEVLTVTGKPTRSELMSSHAEKIPQTSIAEQNVKPSNFPGCSQMTTNISMPTNMKTEESGFDKKLVEAPSTLLSGQTSHAAEALGVNLSVNEDQQASRYQTDDEKPESFFRKWYAFAKLQKLLNDCRKQCREPYTEPNQPPFQILCRMKYRTSE